MSTTSDGNEPNRDARSFVDAFLEGETLAKDGLDTLMDVATGIYVAVTRTAAYFIDLDGMQMMRVPRILDRGAYYMRRDGEWVELLAVADCTVGRGLVLVLDLQLETGAITTRGPSSDVETIARLRC